MADTRQSLQVAIEDALMAQWADGARAGVGALTGAVEAVLRAQEQALHYSIPTDVVRAALREVSEGLIQEMER